MEMSPELRLAVASGVAAAVVGVEKLFGGLLEAIPILRKSVLSLGIAGLILTAEYLEMFTTVIGVSAFAASLGGIVLYTNAEVRSRRVPSDHEKNHCRGTSES